MNLYPNLFAYLNNSGSVSRDTVFQARDRPIIALKPTDNLRNQPFLIPKEKQVYEIAFPYLKPADIAHHDNRLEYTFNLSIGNESHALRVTDEVLDLDTIEEEDKLPEWEARLGNRLDETTAVLIRLLVGMFTELFSEKLTSQPGVWLVQLQEKLNRVDIAQANQPLVVSISRRYQLKRKIDAIASKLRHQLRRQAATMPVSKIQEMDAYCLRDYIRRPGQTAAEKAGSRQELMGIQRYQDYNTAENKFLVYFCNILHLQCYRYQQDSGTQYGEEIQALRRVIDLFRQQPAVQGIQDRQYKFTTPNYVLQQNPIYRSFYQAYLDYSNRKYEKERVWSFRTQLLSDTIYICLQAAIMGFQAIEVDSLAKIVGRNTPEQGSYIRFAGGDDVSGIKLRVFLETKVDVFSLRKPASDEPNCDWLLTVETHHLTSADLETETLKVPIWVFWYCPTTEALNQAAIYLHKWRSPGVILYLQVPPSNSSETGGRKYYSRARLWLWQLPDLIATEAFSSTIELMKHLIRSIGGTQYE